MYCSSGHFMYYFKVEQRFVKVWVIKSLFSFKVCGENLSLIMFIYPKKRNTKINYCTIDKVIYFQFC